MDNLYAASSAVALKMLQQDGSATDGNNAVIPASPEGARLYAASPAITDKYFGPDGSIYTGNGTVVRGPDADMARLYAARPAIADKWLLPDGSVVSMLTGGGNGGGGAQLTGYGEINMPVALQTGTIKIYISAIGETFLSSSVAGTGVYHLNKSNDKLEQVLNTGSSLIYSEDSESHIFVSGAGLTGVYMWDGSTGFVQVYAGAGTFGATGWFDGGPGLVFMASTASGFNGILHFNGTTFDPITMPTYSWGIGSNQNPEKSL